MSLDKLKKLLETNEIIEKYIQVIVEVTDIYLGSEFISVDIKKDILENRESTIRNSERFKELANVAYLMTETTGLFTTEVFTKEGIH